MEIVTEKYRPSKLDDVVGQEHVTSFIKKFVKNKDIPNMLFSGPAGCGKTTTAIALAKELYGKNWKDYFYEINASDENSVETIRNKVKTYAKLKVIGQEYKIIFFDEMDHLSKSAQACLRRIIENSTKTCRFVFSCNYPNKVIQPLIDRCVVFRFKPIKPQSMKIMLDKVVKEENIDITHSALYTLATLSNGSMRRALNTLEKIKKGELTKVDDDTIYNIMGYINDEFVLKLIQATNENDIKYVDKRLSNLLYERVYQPEEIIESLNRLLIDSQVLSEDGKIQALRELGTVEYRIAIGATPEIQLRAFMAYLMMLFKKYKVKKSE